MEEKRGNEVETKCWYTGGVIGDDHSSVALSLCHHQLSTASTASTASTSTSSSSSNDDTTATTTTTTNGGEEEGANNSNDNNDELILNGVIYAFGEQVNQYFQNTDTYTYTYRLYITTLSLTHSLTHSSSVSHNLTFLFFDGIIGYE
jgi:ribulose-5-phosphate 4-epimerase/fuculose-1-phosphate aldolase